MQCVARVEIAKKKQQQQQQQTNKLKSLTITEVFQSPSLY